MTQQTKCIAALLVTLMAMAGCSPASSHEEATPTPIPTLIVPTKPTYEVQRGEVVNTLQFTGRIAPVVEEELFFRTDGYVDAVYVERDGWVHAGDILAELEVTDLKNQLAQAETALALAISNNEQRVAEAEATLRIAELRLAQARAGDSNLQIARAEAEQDRGQVGGAVAQAQLAIAQARLEVAQAELSLAQAGASPEELTIAKAALAKAQAAVRLAQAEYDKIAWRAGLGATPQALALEQATLDLQIAQAEYDRLAASPRQSDLAPLQANVEVAKAQVMLAQAQVIQAEYDIQILEQEVELARTRLEQLKAGLDVEEMRLAVERLKAQLENARLIAPFDGQVLSVKLIEGRAVEAYQPVMVVADPSDLEVSADLQSDQLQDLKEGMPVTAALVSQPDEEIEGYIRRLPYPYGGGGRVTAAEEEDMSTRVALEATAAESRYELGDLIRVTVVLERKDDVLWLPPQAIRTFEGRKFVVVQEGEAQRRVDVKVGIESEDRVEIEEGLTEGQIVIGQ
jgi:RND family efflux transporter MFP subunit